MADHTAGVAGRDISKPEVVAEAIVNAAQERFSGMTPEQIPHNPFGVMRAGVSHLSKREFRETGEIHAGGLTAHAQAALQAARAEKHTEVEDQVREVMRKRHLGAEE